MADARKLVESRLAGWKKSDASAPSVAEPADVSGAKIYFVARPSSVQTNLVVGAPAIARTDAAYDVLQVMNKVIGGGPTVIGDRVRLAWREREGQPPLPVFTAAEEEA